MVSSLNTTVDDKLRILSSRAVVYSTLAKAFGPNTSSLLDKMTLKDLKEALKTLPNYDVEKELAATSDALARNDLNSEVLALEHTRLFEKGVSPPYETSYNIEREEVKTHDLVDVAGFYAAFGIKPHRELPDHVVSELEFMSLLCLKEAYALSHRKRKEAKICAETQRKFIKEHLGPWLSPFHKRVQENAHLPVYPAISNLLQRFVMLDSSFLSAAQ